MNLKMVRFILACILCAECVFMIFPIIVALIYGEYDTVPAFGSAMAATGITAFLLGIKKPEDDRIFSKESFVSVSMGWILLAVFGAIPFYVSGAIPNVVDALFESVSGFTTTGASILADVEALPKGILFWREFTHWIGGMGIIMFILMITQISEGHSLYIMKAEVPGPSVGKVVPKARANAVIMYGIYTALTLLEVIFLLIEGLGWFDAVTTAMGTAGTGGFTVRNAGIAAYGSSAVEWTVAVFMFLFGVNFNVFVLMLFGQLRSALRSEELRIYLLVVLAGTGIIAANLSSAMGTGLGDSIRAAFWQVTSAITTTGYYYEPYMSWPTMAIGVVLFVMFTGACAGSTGGGIKISRIAIAGKAIKNSTHQLSHPHDIATLKFEDRQVDKETKNFVMTYVVMFFTILVFSSMFLMFFGWDIETSFGTALTCLNNVGISFGEVGKAGYFGILQAPVKVFLCLIMLTGRLEIFPLVLLFAPSTWRKQ